MSVRLRSILAACVIAAVVIVIAVLTMLEVLVIRYVLVDGASAYSDEEIIRAAQIDMGGSIFRVDEEELRFSMSQDGRFALEGVTVEYPDTVILHVRERTKDAVIRSGGQMLVMDSDGYVVEVHSTMPVDCGIYVNGLENGSYRIGMQITAPEEKLQAMKAVTEAIRKQNAFGLVSELNLDDLRNIWMLTRTGIRVELGDMNEMDGKIMWMCSAVADLEKREESGTLDVSGGDRAFYLP